MSRPFHQHSHRTRTMKSILLLLALYIFPSTAIGSAAYLIASDRPWCGLALFALAWITLPRFDPPHRRP